MNAATVFGFARKELIVGPRGMLFVMIIFFPVLVNLVIRLLFGGVFTPEPRLGIVDYGGSAMVASAIARPELDVTIYEDETELRVAVEAYDEDAGLTLSAEFDAEVRSGAMPELSFFLNGETSETDRSVLAITMVELVRELAGEPAPVEVQTVRVGSGSSIPLEERMVPLLVLIAVAFAGVFMPAASIVAEKESGTINAVLATPATSIDLVGGKGLVGFAVALLMGTATLLINSGLNESTLALVVVMAVAALMSSMFGLLLGIAVNNSNTMFSVWKSGGIIIFGPAILFLFPSVPRWIAMLFPTYYFLGPLHRMAVEGEALAPQLGDLGIALLISVALAAAVRATSHGMVRRLSLA